MRLPVSQFRRWTNNRLAAERFLHLVRLPHKQTLVLELSLVMGEGEGRSVSIAAPSHVLASSHSLFLNRARSDKVSVGANCGQPQAGLSEHSATYRALSG
jgi:hypothetical protein